MKTIGIFFAISLSIAANAQDCKSMTSMVRLLSSPVPTTDQPTVEQNLSSFCSDYEKLVSDNKKQAEDLRQLKALIQTNTQTLAKYKDAKVYAISTPKTEHKNKTLEIGKHAYCALSLVGPSHATQPCTCEASQNAATRVWTLSLSVAENVVGACACRATCTGSE